MSKVVKRYFKKNIKKIFFIFSPVYRYIIFIREFYILKKSNDGSFEVRWKNRYPCLKDSTNSVPFDRHYVYHTAWMARMLAQSKVYEHFDIGSSLYFSSIASAFVNIKHFDYRSPDLYLKNLNVGSEDLLNLSFDSNSIASISCMHVIEHVGLGRYGDELDFYGDSKAANELTRVLSTGGQLYIVVPIANKAKIFFNAHRVYSVDLVRSLFSSLKLVHFSLIPQSAADGGLVTYPREELISRQEYGCGCFVFTKE